MNFAVTGPPSGAWLMAVMSSWILRASRPVAVSRRSTEMPTAMLAIACTMRRSQAEQGRSPALRAVIAASQSMAAIGVPMLVPCSMKRLVKSTR
jgi:hypothetical protein